MKRYQVLIAPLQSAARALSHSAAESSVYFARPLIVAFSMCFGAIVYFSLHFEPSLKVIGLAVVVTSIGLWCIMKWCGSLPILIAVVLFGASIGMLASKTRTASIAPGMINQTTSPVMVEGWVSNIEPATKGVRIRLKTHAVEGMADEERPLFVRLSHRTTLKVAPGQFVRCLAILRPPPHPSIPGDYDFRRQAWFQQLHAVGYVQGRCRGGAIGKPLSNFAKLQLDISSKRRVLAGFTNSAAGARAGGFAAALVSGDRSYMSEDDRVALRRAGLAHLLAISGLHIGIVCGLVYIIIFRSFARIEWLSLRVPIQKPAAMIALLFGAGYMIISGASVSTQRAFIMAALVFTAMLFDRNAFSLRTYAIAMMVVIILKPESVMSPGFQMSFAATGVLIAIYEAWRERRLNVPQGFGSKQAFAVKSIFVTSLAAGIATAPYAFFHFDRVAPYGFVANLVAMPVVTFISAPAAAIALLLAPFGLAEHGLRLFGWSLEIVLAVAHWNAGFSSDVGPQWKPMPPISLLIFSFAIAAFIMFRGKLRARISASVCALALLIWAGNVPASAYWSPSGDVFVWKGGKYERILFADGDGLSPLSFKSLQPSGFCKNQRCLVETDHGRLLMVGTGDLVDCSEVAHETVIFTMSTDQPRCSNTVLFEDIQKKGGAAVRLGRSSNRIHFSNKCATRPWQIDCNR